MMPLKSLLASEVWNKH